ncbi:AraC family transcriptional regulator [Aureibacter tunicatorum]|uniref:AraC family transcriptional regulator n=1 Tax=Aureibacter tunicatorum TaxID=866807 RepID=A0AAE3XS10_9BACT|nr:GyrI-like domain-containing protein [Aureibacter tunicatorum]MDR6240394.1 AraC family transcriptional regulator [Aureibacter tunicatorum]BDD05726.1 AraC family transcriptional regulator [Aureibacter tunicatorum]
MKSYHRIKIHDVFEYIDRNLNEDLSLEVLANQASMSPYHFHRIFKMITSETPNGYIVRRKIEKSASELVHHLTSITEIALMFGFQDNSSFTRSFKKYYGMSPTAFRLEHPNKFLRIKMINSKNGQVYPDSEQYICFINELKQWIMKNAKKVGIKNLPAMQVAYIHSMGLEELGRNYQKLVQWGMSEGLMNDQSQMITIYHDSFKVTEPHKVRMDACLLLQKELKQAKEEVRLKFIPEGKFIVGSFELGMQEFEQAWTGLFLWMNENEYQKADREPFGIYYNDFNSHPEKKAIVDLCIPIK